MPGSIVWLLLNENSGLPVIKLAMGEPWLIVRLVLAVWLLRKLKLPPMSK